MWVRTATRKDLAAVSKLLSKTWHATYDAIYGHERVSEITTEWHSVSAISQKIRMLNSECLVADDGDAIAGMAYAREDEPGEVKLHQLYVLPEFHGRGVGQLLLNEIEGSFFDARRFVLEVEAQNTPAIRFYQKHGYSKIGGVDNCGREDSGIAALVFAKQRR